MLRAWVKYSKSIKRHEEFKGVSRIYKKIYAMDPQRLTLSFFPYMAVNGKGQVGALQAEAFSECCFFVIKQVVNDTSTRLGDNFVEKVMKFIKANHHHEVCTT